MCSKGNPSSTTAQQQVTNTNQTNNTQGQQLSGSLTQLGPNPDTLALYNNFLAGVGAIQGAPFDANMMQQTVPWTAGQDAASNYQIGLGMQGMPYGADAAALLNQGAQSTVGQIPGVANSLLSPWANQAVNYGQQQGQAISDYAKNLAAQGPQLQQFSQGAIDQYMSPYINDVVNATQNQFTNANAQQGNVLLGQGIRAGNAFGGDRAGVAAAQLGNQQQLAQAPVIAGLYDKGYNTALGEFNTQNALATQLGQMAIQGQLAGGQLGMQGYGLGLNAAGQANALAAQALAQNQNAALQGGTNLGQLGGLQYSQNLAGGAQANQAAQIYPAYLQNLYATQAANAQMANAYPFQTSSWYGGLLQGIGGLTGTQQQNTGAALSNYLTNQQGTSLVNGTGSATPAQPNSWLQAAGLGLAGLGLFAKRGGAVPRRADGGDVRGASPKDLALLEKLSQVPTDTSNFDQSENVEDRRRQRVMSLPEMWVRQGVGNIQDRYRLNREPRHFPARPSDSRMARELGYDRLRYGGMVPRRAAGGAQPPGRDLNFLTGGFGDAIGIKPMQATHLAAPNTSATEIKLPVLSTLTFPGLSTPSPTSTNTTSAAGQSTLGQATSLLGNKQIAGGLQSIGNFFSNDDASVAVTDTTGLGGGSPAGLPTQAGFRRGGAIGPRFRTGGAVPAHYNVGGRTVHVRHRYNGGNTDDENYDDFAGPTQSTGATWFDTAPQGYSGKGGLWSDPSGAREGPPASGAGHAEPGIATPNRRTLGHWFQVQEPDGSWRNARQTDLGPGQGPQSRGIGLDINAPLADDMGFTPGNFPSGRQMNYRYAGPGPGLPEQANVGLPDPRDAEEQPDIKPSLTGGGRDIAQGGPQQQGPRRIDFGIPQRPQGFLERWASNPLTQFGLGLASAKGAGLTGVAEGLNMGLGNVQAQKIANDKLDQNYKIDTSGDTVRLIYANHAIDTKLTTGRARLAQQQRMGKIPEGMMMNDAGVMVPIPGYVPKKTAAQQRPVVIGEDKYGTKIYGVPDPANPGSYLNPVTGKPVGEQPAQQVPEQTVQTEVSPPQEGATAAEESGTIPVNAVFAQGFFNEVERTPDQILDDQPTQSIKNPAILEQYPEIANEVKAISEGRAKFPARSSRNARDVIIRKVLHDYDPGADETTFQRRQRTATSFAVGVEGRNLTAANTFGQHLGRMDRIITELNNSGVTDITSLRNTIARHAGSVISKDMEKLQNLLGQYDEASKALGDEGAKVFAGTQSALADRKEWQANLPQASDTLNTAKAKLSEMVHLVDGRIISLADQYNRGMRTKHKMEDLLAPKTREVFDKVRVGDGQPKAGSAPAAQSKTEKPAAHPDQIQNGILYQFDEATGKYKGVKRVQ